MLKFHPISAFMKMHANFQKNYIRVFWFKYRFPIKYKIRILDLMLFPKNSVPFEGLYYSSYLQLLNTGEARKTPLCRFLCTMCASDDKILRHCAA